jgi:hypothetical protein
MRATACSKVSPENAGSRPPTIGARPSVNPIVSGRRPSDARRKINRRVESGRHPTGSNTVSGPGPGAPAIERSIAIE